MNSFRTEIQVPAASALTHANKAVFIGSCFTENIGARLQQHHFNVAINPFGIVYNPASVARSLELLIERQEFTPEDLHYHNEQWFSYYYHSSFSHADQSVALAQMNARMAQGHAQLKTATHLFITLGSAWVFKHIQSKQVVSNCHKIPAFEFERYKLSVKQLLHNMTDALDQLKVFNPGLKVVWTISPVRHWKDGAVDNQLSKATLVVAVHELVQQYGHTYFPAYELMLDDLRDYRFYEADMLHPNSVATDYIWEKFGDAFFSASTQQLNQQIAQVVRAAQHRPFNPNSQAHQQFKAKQLEHIAQLEKAHPALDFSKEKASFT